MTVPCYLALRLFWAVDGSMFRLLLSMLRMLLIGFTLLASWRLVLEKAHPRYLRPGRSISVSAVPFGPGIDIWRSCLFIAAMMRSLGRFVPCSIGDNHEGEVWPWAHLQALGDCLGGISK